MRKQNKRVRDRGCRAQSRARISIVGVIISTLFMGCGVDTTDEIFEDAWASAMNSKAELTSTQETILRRMATRERDYLRGFKEDLSIGETYDGMIGEPDEPAPAGKDPEYAQNVRRIIIEENEDRSAFYLIEVEKYLVDTVEVTRTVANNLIDQKIAESLGVTSKQAFEQAKTGWFCSKLLFWLDCEAIEKELYLSILSAVEAAIAATLEQLSEEKDRVLADTMKHVLDQIKENLVFQVHRVHAKYWQDRRTRSGEWIQERRGVWQLKS